MHSQYAVVPPQAAAHAGDSRYLLNNCSDVAASAVEHVRGSRWADEWVCDAASAVVEGGRGIGEGQAGALGRQKDLSCCL